MVRTLVIASLIWPVVLGSGVLQRAQGGSSSWSTIVYLASSRICHQRPERSFDTGGVPWPVCGRCAGLYLAAPVGALLAVGWRRRRRWERGRTRWWLAAASVPTVATLALEWIGLAEVSNVDRFVTALPLGAMVALVIVRTAARRPQPIE